MIVSSCRPPIYPKQAIRQLAEGTVNLLFKVGPEGRVMDSILIQSSGNKYLDSAAHDSLRLCRYSPTTVEGTPVESWSPVEYHWYFR